MPTSVSRTAEWGKRLLPHGTVKALQSTKHHVAVFVKRARWGFPQWRGPLLEPLHAWRQRRRPRPFPAATYADTWLAASAAGRHVEPGESVARRLFVVWTGDNAMPEQRRRSLDEIRRVNGVLDVVLVTPDTIGDWLVPELALPPQYEHLSLVHRSDVLRAYLLHVHGGGYSDVKRPREPWLGAYERLEQSGAWILGYTERHRLNAPLVGGRLQQDLRSVSQQLLGYGGLVVRPRTALTEEWWTRVCAVLDDNTDALAANPGNVRGDNPGYPLGWTEVLAHVVAPLTWKYQDHVLHDERVLPELRNYQ
ncbi:hypothetical protein J2X46_001110 [Nocardioides sp. BE266]|uniref:hypothetical protein n=1 Tax=Nocardioides sp. BE266 TaxID=2817725 RepID=UPI00285C125C|nr:hypothetical protein [Nocardioides sp. BE266]MDR7252134.1 hypothetical protein [Nocardioides sp. BE266]